jgi:molybdenum cofactor cytidylyltransferase
MVEKSARSALDAGCRVLLVVGNRGEEVLAPFETETYGALRAEGKLRLIANPRWEEGMLGSIQAALSEVSGSAFFVAHADMPFVGAASYRALEARRGEWKASGGREAAFIASHEGRGGHPALLPAAWIPDILGLPPASMLKPFLAGRERVWVAADKGALRDIDTPEEYLAALEACKRPESM